MTFPLYFFQTKNSITIRPLSFHEDTPLLFSLFTLSCPRGPARNSPLSTGRSQSLPAPADPTSSGLRVIALRSGRAPASAAAPPAGPPGPAEPPFVHQPYAL